MKRDEIRTEVERHLDICGLGGAFAWVGPSLVLNIDGRIVTIAMKSGISRKKLDFQLGRIAGMAEFSGALARATAARRARTTGHQKHEQPAIPGG